MSYEMNEFPNSGNKPEHILKFRSFLRFSNRIKYLNIDNFMFSIINSFDFGLL